MPHVVGLWRAAHEAPATTAPGATGAQRAPIGAPGLVSIQVLTVAERDLAPGPVAALTRADFLPPTVVLCLQLAVGWAIGANPLVLIAGAAAIIAVAYVVWATARTRRALGAQAPIAASFVGPSPGEVSATDLPPIASPSSDPRQTPALGGEHPADSSTPSAAATPPTRPTSDLRWLWGTILRDPTPRSSRRDRD